MRQLLNILCILLFVFGCILISRNSIAEVGGSVNAEIEVHQPEAGFVEIKTISFSEERNCRLHYDVTVESIGGSNRSRSRQSGDFQSVPGERIVLGRIRNSMREDSVLRVHLQISDQGTVVAEKTQTIGGS